MKKKKIDIKTIREKIIMDYSRKRGWNPNNLSPSQLYEIMKSKEFQQSIR